MRGYILKHMFGPMALCLFHPEFLRRFDSRIHSVTASCSLNIETALKRDVFIIHCSFCRFEQRIHFVQCNVTWTFVRHPVQFFSVYAQIFSPSGAVLSCTGHVSPAIPSEAYPDDL